MESNETTWEFCQALRESLLTLGWSEQGNVYRIVTPFAKFFIPMGVLMMYLDEKYLNFEKGVLVRIGVRWDTDLDRKLRCYNIPVKELPREPTALAIALAWLCTEASKWRPRP